MRLLVLCLLFVCPALARAQDGRKVSCRFLCLEGVAAPPPLVNMSSKGNPIACGVPANTFSAPTVCHLKGNAMSFLTAADLKPAAVATIPANVKTAILVFAPAETSADALPWRVWVIEDFAATFPDGGTLAANLCTRDVRFTIDDNPVTLQPGKVHCFPRPLKRDDFNMAAVTCHIQQDDSWRTVSESLLRFAPGMRFLTYAYFDATSGRPCVVACQDIPPAKPPAKK